MKLVTLPDSAAAGCLRSDWLPSVPCDLSSCVDTVQLKSVDVIFLVCCFLFDLI